MASDSREMDEDERMAAMDEDREKTLRVLVELAIASDPVPCYDGQRAERLLRSQSSREELAQLGVAPEFLDRLWPRES
jgi:hypothetical protein